MAEDLSAEQPTTPPLLRDPPPPPGYTDPLEGAGILAEPFTQPSEDPGAGSEDAGDPAP